jgi:hypothetical protein
MKYDELLIKIREVKIEYEKRYKKPLETFAEFEKYVIERQIRFGKRKALSSLKGFDL